MIPNFLVGCVLVCVIGVPATALGVAVELLEKGRRCKKAPAWQAWLKPLAALAARLWERLATFELPAPAAPVPAPRRPVNGRRLPDGPRRTPRPGPFTAVDMPACAGPEPGPAQHDDIEPAPPVLGFARSLVYGEACQRDVAEAERLAEAMRS